MFKNKKLYIILTFSILCIIFLPLLVDWLIIGNTFPSNISNSDWVGFLGEYIGVIIGSIVSFVGIAITIRYTNEQNRKDRELQVRPYCAIRYVPTPKTLSTRKQLGCFMLGCKPQENNGERYQSVIYIKNIGIGPAIEFEFDVDDINDGREHYMILPQHTPETENNKVNLLQPGEEAILPISIFFNFDKITKNDICENKDIEEGLGKYYINPAIQSKYKNFDIKITVKYFDIFEDMFIQTIILASNMHTSLALDGSDAKHECDIFLKEVSSPKKISNRKSINI